MPVINTNAAANAAVRYLNLNSAQETSSLSKLSSGSRITSASDDAAGLAISTRISSDVTTLQQAATNASQATSILQTADGGASNISDILARMKSLASQSASGTTTDSSRAYINSEFSQLSSEIDSIATGTRYSGQSLLDGSSVFAAGVSVLVRSAYPRSMSAPRPARTRR
jgi:flagellin